MNDRNYYGHLCNWASVASRFDLDRGEPPFVWTALDSDGTTYLELALWSDDGHRFCFAAAEGPCRGGQELLVGPLSSSPRRLPEKLLPVSPLVRPHLPTIAAWRRHVAPPRDLPKIVRISGPEAGVLRVVRNGLGLSGTRLAEALSHGGLVQVSPAELFALRFWQARVPQVSIRRPMRSRGNLPARITAA